MLLRLASRPTKAVDTAHLAPIMLAVYFLSVGLGFAPGIAVSGLVIWGMLPGHYLLHFLKIPKISLAGYLILGSVLSFVITILPLVLFRSQIAFTDKSQVGFITLLNLAVYAAYLVFRRREKEGIEVTVTRNEIMILGLSLLPFLMFALRSILNPYLVDQDGASYLKVMQEIKRTHVDGSFLGARRAAFTNAAMSLSYMLQIEFLPILKFVLPGYVWFILGLPFALFTDMKKKGWLALAGLLLLSSAAMASGVDRVKPEILIFMLWFTTVLFFMWTVTTGRIAYYVVGLAIAFLSFRSHDTGAITLLSYLAAGVVLAIWHRKQIRVRITPRNVLLAAVIILPYLQIFQVSTIFYSVRETFISLPQTGGLHFRLWFLNDYQSGGVLAGWPGWMFVLFYLFNGFTAIIFLIVALKRLSKQKNVRTWVALSLPIVSLITYLGICEIMPRFGIFFLPDRAWVHFFYDACIIFLLVGYLSEPGSIQLPAWLRGLGWLSIGGGVSIALLLTVTLGSIVSRSEEAGIQEIRSLPNDAIILSSQPFNDILTEVYGGHEFVSVNLPEDEDSLKGLGELKGYLNSKIDSGTIQRQSKDLHTVRQTTTETITDAKDNGILVTRTTRVLSDTETSTSVESGKPLASSPVYLLYSFAKTDGLQSKLGRASWLSGIDLPNRDLMASFDGTKKDVVYRDKSMLLIKIR